MKEWNRNRLVSLAAILIELAAVLVLFFMIGSLKQDTILPQTAFQIGTGALSLVYMILMMFVIWLDSVFTDENMVMLQTTAFCVAMTTWCDAMACVMAALKESVIACFVFTELTYVFEVLFLREIGNMLIKSLPERKSFRIMGILVRIFCIFSVILIAVNFQKPVLFQLDSQSGFHAGSFLYLFCVLYSLFLLVYAAEVLRSRVPFFLKLFLLLVASLGFGWPIQNEERFYWTFSFSVVIFTVCMMQIYLKNSCELSEQNREILRAAEIQKAILPTEPFTVPGGEVTAEGIMKPSRRIGGDLYGYEALPENRVLFFIGDVSDKGLDAAFFMTRAYTLIRTFTDMHLPPEEIMERTNTMLCRKNTGFYFVTLWLGFLDIESGRLQYVNAGHDCPLCLHRNGTLEEFKGNKNMALGIMPGRSFRSSEAFLCENDRILLYTDGASDAHNSAGERFGMTRLRQAFIDAASQEKSPVLACILGKIEEFSETVNPYDDITMMEIHYQKREDNVNV